MVQIAVLQNIQRAEPGGGQGNVSVIYAALVVYTNADGLETQEDITFPVTFEKSATSDAMQSSICNALKEKAKAVTNTEWLDSDIVQPNLRRG